MALVVGGVICFVLGAVAFFVWRSQQKSLNTMLVAETLTAPESGHEVVWHRSEAIEHYWDTERDSDGDTRQVEKTRVVASHVSQAPFVVRDETGEIVVETSGADVDNAPVLADTYERDLSKVGPT